MTREELFELELEMLVAIADSLEWAIREAFPEVEVEVEESERT